MIGKNGKPKTIKTVFDASRIKTIVHPNGDVIVVGVAGL